MYNSIVLDAGNNLNLDGVDTGNNLINVDPFFKDPEGLDLEPLAGSPAIDVGSSDPPGGLGDSDADGADRVEGPSVDIGAREFRGTGEFWFLTQIGNGQAGNIILDTALEVGNAGDERRAFAIDFFDSSGAPWPLDLEGVGPVTTVAVALEPYQTWSARTSGTGGIASGYARVRTGTNVDATAIFTRKDAPTGTILYQAGVPSSQSIISATLFVDTLRVQDTGIAIVNINDLETLADSAAGPAPSGLTDQVQLKLYDPQFHLLDSTMVDLASGEHRAQFVTELFPDNAQVGEMQGILTARSNSLIALVTLRQNDDPALDFPNEVPTLAAFPVLEQSPEDGLASVSGSGEGEEPFTFYFAQIGNGRADSIGFETSVNLANISGGAADLQIDFFDPLGSPLALNLVGQGTGSSFSFELESGESLFLKTDGVGEIQVGWARVTTSHRDVDGSAVFSRFDVPSGILETESGVPSTTARNRFAIFVDTLGDSDTGLAIASLGTAPAGGQPAADIDLELYDTQGQLLDSRVFTLAPGKQTAQFVTQLFSDVPGIEEMRGFMVARRGSELSTPSMAPVTLRQNDDPSISFPEDIGTLTAFPVLRVR